MSRCLAAAAAVSALLAAGCSGGESDDPETSARSLPEPPPATETGTTDTGTGTGTDGETEPAPVNPPRPGAGGPMQIEEIASGLDSPVHAAAAPGEPGRLYVVEQPGRIVVLERGELQDEPFLDIVADVQSGGEQGLLSVAFHPDYESNRLFYVNYTNRMGDTRVSEFEAARAGPTSGRTLLAVAQPYPNHNGGQLAFGPDGLLYVGMGDGGSSGDPENRAQDLTSRLGKLLRLDVDEPGADWELVGYGLRNPWRFSFDRLTGDLWLGDVGQDQVEEIDFVPAESLDERLNFGWDVFEGSYLHEDKELTSGGELVVPVSEYGHDFGCSVTGGFVYRGRDVRRQAQGRYFYGDFCSGRIWSLALWRGEVTRRGHPFRVEGLTSFGEGLTGELYLLSQGGTVYRLAPL